MKRKMVKALALLNALPIKPEAPKLAGPDENGRITLPFLHDVTTT